MKFFIENSIFADVLKMRQAELSKSLFETLQELNEDSSAIIVAERSLGTFRSSKRDALKKTLKYNRGEYSCNLKELDF